MNINEHETLEIPLSQLFAWDGNVRTMETDEPESGEETDIGPSALRRPGEAPARRGPKL